MSERGVHILIAAFAAMLVGQLASVEAASGPTRTPNVIVLLTDDQGYGELSCNGNPVLKTPHLDRLHAESIRFTDFHVAPMCTPTRGQLKTGVDCLRNRAMNVSSGRTLLRRDLPTMADSFAAAGYATGIFGKWHLGDNYPYRPQDRGFLKTLWYPSSHIGSAPDAWDNDYFDDTYWHNGRRRAFTGYTTDVFFREAIRWMREEAEAGKPFLCYLPTAAPHGPHFVPAKDREAMETLVAQADLPKLAPAVRTELTRYLAMIANIDENVGRLEAFLRETGLRDNTILVFVTDNGSTFGPRYFNAGMRGGKVTLWEGGHRVPCFVRWPAGKLRPPGNVAGLTEVGRNERIAVPAVLASFRLVVPELRRCRDLFTAYGWSWLGSSRRRGRSSTASAWLACSAARASRRPTARSWCNSAAWTTPSLSAATPA